MVKFLKPYSRYNRGEAASFSTSHEAWLIRRGLAEQIRSRKVEETPVAKSAGTEKKDPEKKDMKEPPLGPQTRQTTVGPQTRK